MKRIISLCLLAAALLSLGGCGKKVTPVLRVGVALYKQDDTFISSVAQQLQYAALEAEQSLGLRLNLHMADAGGSQTAQNEQVDQMLRRGCQVLCVNVVDRTAAAVIVDKAKSADVPVIFFNRQPVDEDLGRWEHAYYVGSRAERAGVLQGQLAAQAWLQDNLDKNGDGVLQYLMLEGEAGHQDALLRTEYSIKTLTAQGIRTEKLASFGADWQRGQARLQVAQWLPQTTQQAEVILANNDDMALGAIDAYLEAGFMPEELPCIVGVDATEPGLSAVRDGTMQGTVRNDARGQAEGLLQLSLALTCMKDTQHLQLENGRYLWLQYAAVTRENLEQYLPGE